MTFKQKKDLISRLRSNIKELIEKFEREEYKQICEFILVNDKLKELEEDLF